jgi:5-formyltetrahydrofolate cyclo-ligase
MKIGEQKKKLREQMLLKRKTLSRATKAEYDSWVCTSLLRMIADRNCKTIHCYIPMKGEINIIKLVESLLELGLTVVAPKTLPNRKLKNLVLTSLGDIEKGVFGTVHPAEDNEYVGEYDLIIVPGLAFDIDNCRLGYGGGYYDNFVVQHPKASKVGIFYPFQEVEKTPTESHDVRLDDILVNRDFIDL